MAAMLAGLALLNVLIAPVALACERLNGDEVTTAAPPAHDATAHHASKAAAGPSGQVDSGSNLTPASAECPDSGGACRADCAAMAGCSLAQFVAQVANTSASPDAQGGLLAFTQHAVHRPTAPDHPPPRA